MSTHVKTRQEHHLKTILDRHPIPFLPCLVIVQLLFEIACCVQLLLCLVHGLKTGIERFLGSLCMSLHHTNLSHYRGHACNFTAKCMNISTTLHAVSRPDLLAIFLVHGADIISRQINAVRNIVGAQERQDVVD